tara:strand:- start:582 stop:1553 length:972 start_codon:yes stop_codon:yes gene_type:complete
MTIQNIRIDTTTNSKVFNPMSASGQWLCSAFGKRSPGNINAQYPVLVEMTQDLPDLQSVTLYSEYGDAMEWPHIQAWLRVMTYQGVYTMIETYGMGDSKFYSQIADQSVYVVFNIDGMWEQSGKVFLNSDWKTIKENIRILGSKAHVKFHKFKHNAYQENALQTFCVACKAHFEVVEDPLFGRRIHSIIDERKNWLYDVHDISWKGPTLHQTQIGWNILKTKVPRYKGKSIEVQKNIEQPLEGKRIPTDDMLNITIKGHIIKGSSLSQIFSNALCEDWLPEMIDQKSDYNKSVVLELYKMSRKDLDAINIYKNDIDSIMEQLQ